MSVKSKNYSMEFAEKAIALTSQFNIEGLDQCFVDILHKCLPHCEVGIFAGSSRGVNSLSGLLTGTSPKRKMNGDFVMTLGPGRTSRKLVIDGKLSKAAEKRLKPVLQIYENQLNHLKRSTYDKLTNLLNREAFEDLFIQRYEEYIDDRRSKIHKSALALVDVDHFKKVNDKFGHVIGDEVLLLIAGIMKSALRQSDRIYRLGGEEFVIVLHSVRIDRAMQVLEKLKDKIADHAFPQAGQVTVSMGVSLMDQLGSSDLFLGRSDAALYYAKNHGRNQIYSYEELRKEGLIEPVEAREGSVELFRIQRRLI